MMVAGAASAKAGIWKVADPKDLEAGGPVQRDAGFGVEEVACGDVELRHARPSCQRKWPAFLISENLCRRVFGKRESRLPFLSRRFRSGEPGSEELLVTGSRFCTGFTADSLHPAPHGARLADFGFLSRRFFVSSPLFGS
jgi:hypothetical protein